jgi:toxin FitB
VSFLLDTNVLSEVRRPQPDHRVMAWLDTADEDRLFISVLSLAEIQRGVALLAPSRRRDVLAAWLREDIPTRFSGRLLDVTPPIALAWGDLMAQARAVGMALDPMDGFFAATALTHGFTLVTRNLKDFAGLGVTLLNPWDEPAHG